MNFNEFLKKFFDEFCQGEEDRKTPSGALEIAGINFYWQVINLPIYGDLICRVN